MEQHDPRGPRHATRCSYGRDDDKEAAATPLRGSVDDSLHRRPHQGARARAAVYWYGGESSRVIASHKANHEDPRSTPCTHTLVQTPKAFTLPARSSLPLPRCRPPSDLDRAEPEQRTRQEHQAQLSPRGMANTTSSSLRSVFLFTNFSLTAETGSVG